MANKENIHFCKNTLKDCHDVFLMDLAITATHILIITNKGLLVSNHFAENKKRPFFSIISSFSGLVSLPNANNSKLDTITLRMSCTHLVTPGINLEQTVLLYSKRWNRLYIGRTPFKLWKSLSMPNDSIIVSAAFHEQRQIIIILLINSNKIPRLVDIKYPEMMWSSSFFTFPTDFKPNDMMVSPPNGNIYGFGNQVWMSEDGGHFFMKFKDLEEDSVLTDSQAILSTEEIIFATKQNKIIFSKPGIKRLLTLNVPHDLQDNTSNHRQYVFFYEIKTQKIVISVLMKSEKYATFTHGKYILMKLLKSASEIHPSVYCYQPISSTEILLFQYQLNPFSTQAKVFYSYFTGKVVVHRNGGKGLITQVFTNNMPKGFIAAIKIQIFSAFTPVSSLSFHIDIIQNEVNQVVLISDNRWNENDEGLTLVNEENLSILLIKYEGPSKMQGLLIKQTKFTKVEANTSNWYLYDFRTSLSSGFASITFNLPQASLLCKSFLNFKIYSCCPHNKFVRFKYPYEDNVLSTKYSENLETDDLLFYYLPPNYRPPSKYGIGVPISKNIYNGDPSKLRYHDRTYLSQFTGKYKQCHGKENRSQCLCSNAMKHSSLEKYSDCKEKVMIIRHQDLLPLTVILYSPGKDPRPLNPKEYVQLLEVNEREDFQITDHQGNELPVNKQSYFSPKINFIFQGSGLYHFRLTVHPSFSKCDLTDEFQVYVIPLDVPYPLYYLWNCLIFLFTAIILLASYIWFSKTNPSPQNIHQ